MKIRNGCNENTELLLKEDKIGSEWFSVRELQILDYACHGFKVCSRNFCINIGEFQQNTTVGSMKEWQPLQRGYHLLRIAERNYQRVSEVTLVAKPGKAGLCEH